MRLDKISACVFDAYGTLFDVSSVCERCRDVLGKDTERFSSIWRQKQLEYTWLRSLRGDYVDFWHVTGQSLDFTLLSMGIENHSLRTRLMEAYLLIDAFPDARTTLENVKKAGLKAAILSNGSLSMLIAAVRRAGLEKLLDELISVDSAKIYKPHPSVYQLAVDRLRMPAEHICFISGNGWDVSGAAHFGFRAVWLNRLNAPLDQLPGKPEISVDSLSAFSGLLDPLPR
jgi:2-haloacid dehalogenase